MNVEVTRLPESRVTLKIELTPAEVEKSLDRTYKRLVQRVSIPGFRKGKAPRPVLERAVGEDVFLHEATDDALEWGYEQAVDQENLVPLERAEVSAADGHDHLHPGEPFRYEITVSVRPQVELPDYHAIHVDVPTVTVEGTEVQVILHDLQERQAMLEPVQRPAQIGDVVTMNLNARVGGEEVIKQENADVELTAEADRGIDEILPGLSQQLVGTTPADIRELSIPLPEDYANPEWAGKTAFVTALTKEVKRKVLPELNDELAQSVSRYETLDDLKSALERNVELEKRNQANEQLVREAIEALVSRTFVDIPPVLVEEELDRMMNDLSQAFSGQGQSFEMYLQSVDKTVNDMREEMREGAIENVKTSLVLAALADAESIEISNDQISAELEAMVQGLRLSNQERKRLHANRELRSSIRTRLRRQAAIRRLVAVVSGEDLSEPAVDATEAEPAEQEHVEDSAAVEIGS
ncbi:MAG TPA: trigger factor [Chloroflexota bacterium]|nr:trigger factor [Chloroflexota bacterium]